MGEVYFILPSYFLFLEVVIKKLIQTGTLPSYFLSLLSAYGEVYPSKTFIVFFSFHIYPL